MSNDEQTPDPHDHPLDDSVVSDEMADYLQVYLDETDDELESIVEALLTLEDDPHHSEALNEAFRLLHTLKGSAGMMGFTDVSELAHELEDRFDNYRSGREVIGVAATSAVLSCLDALRDWNQQLRAGKTAELDLSSLRNRLSAFDADRAAQDDAAKSPEPPSVDRVLSQNSLILEGAYRVEVEFEPNLQLADLKARLIVARLSRIGEIIATDPAIDDIRSVDDLSGITVTVMSHQEPAEVKSIADVDGVREVRMTGRAMHTGESLANSRSGSEFAPLPDAAATRDDEDQQPTIEERAVPPSSAMPEAPTLAARSAETFESPRQPPAVETDHADDSMDSARSDRDSAVAATVRVDIDRLDHLMNLTGELVVTKARFSQIVDALGAARRSRRAGGDVRDLRDRIRERLGQLKSVYSSTPDVETESQGIWRELEADLHELQTETDSWDELRQQCGQIFEAMDQLKRVSSSLQQGVLDTRMVPIAPLFSRFRRVIRDLCTERNKQVRLHIDGEKTELDKRMIDELGDPLIHLVRNSIDHGIESTAERQRLGKPIQGTIRLSAGHSGNNVLIRVSDDGAGISVEQVRRKALARGLTSESSVSAMSNQEMMDFIWEPGFSTAEQITEISGRGVGLDVVRDRITGLNGTIELTSEQGSGTTFQIRLPLTLAIMRSLLIRSSTEIFSIPIDDVREIVSVPTAQVQRIHQCRTIDVRGEFIRITTMNELMEWNHSDKTKAPAPGPTGGSAATESLEIVIVRSGDKTLGLCVDELLGSSDVVIKSLAENFREIPGLSGASVMGTGDVCLMLDAHALVQLA